MALTIPPLAVKNLDRARFVDNGGAALENRTALFISRSRGGRGVADDNRLACVTFLVKRLGRRCVHDGRRVRSKGRTINARIDTDDASTCRAAAELDGAGRQRDTLRGFS